MQQQITEIFELATEKNIPQADIQTAFTILTASANAQAQKTCKKESSDISFEQLIQAVEIKLKTATTEADLENLNKSLDLLVSQEGTSFIDTFNSILTDLLSKYIEKLKQL